MIPGEEIRQAIEKLWDQNLFSDVRINYTRIEGDVIFWIFFPGDATPESIFRFRAHEDRSRRFADKVKLVRGNLVTPYTLQTAQNAVQNHFNQ
jgi:outer membrane protein insertion porin family